MKIGVNENNEIIWRYYADNPNAGELFDEITVYNIDMTEDEYQSHIESLINKKDIDIHKEIYIDGSIDVVEE